VFPLTKFNSSHRQIDIVHIKDEISTLFYVVIVDPTRANIFPQSCTIKKFVIPNVAQAKEGNYGDWHPTNQFHLLAIEVFLMFTQTC